LIFVLFIVLQARSKRIFPVALIVLFFFHVLRFFGPICNDTVGFMEGRCKSLCGSYCVRGESRATLVGRGWAPISLIWLAFTAEQWQELLNSCRISKKLQYIYSWSVA
jgi:hypothetical protein